MINLNDFKSNVYSQNGEDGILEWLLKCVDEPSGFVIEFGAADGLFCSNTAKLWRDNGYEALLMESDPELFGKLCVEVEGRSGIEAVMAEVRNVDDHTTRVADVCSIDVDGADYFIAMNTQTPHKIVVIEYNPTVPVHVEMIGKLGTMQGSSALSITKMMEEKGYTLVACTKTNLIFFYGSPGLGYETDLSVLFDTSSLNYIVVSADGFYDTIGEFGYGMESKEEFAFHAISELSYKIGYGMESKEEFALYSQNPLDRTLRFDATTRERVRQFKVNYLSAAEFAEEIIEEFEELDTGER